jgi:hypothetical protein
MNPRQPRLENRKKANVRMIHEENASENDILGEEHNHRE